MLVNDTPAMEMLDVRWAAGLHLSYDESAWAASRSRHRMLLGIVRVWRRQVAVRQRLPWLSRRSELFTQNPACLRLRPARILPLARHRRRRPGVGNDRHGARLHAVLPPDTDRGTPGQCGVDDGQAARPLRFDNDQSPSRRPDGSVHLPHAIEPELRNPIPTGREARRVSAEERNGLLGHLVRPKRRSALRLREPRRLPRALDRRETAELLSSLRTWRDRSLAGLMLLSGLRSGELLTLDVTDIDMGARWVRVMGKGAKERRVPLDVEVAGLIQT